MDVEYYQIQNSNTMRSNVTHDPFDVLGPGFSWHDSVNRSQEFGKALLLGTFSNVTQSPGEYLQE